MPKNIDNDELSALTNEVAERIRMVREKVLKVSWAELTETHVPGYKYADQRVYDIEDGRGGAKWAYMVLKAIWSRGIDLNFIFGDDPNASRRRGGDDFVYAENVTDYLSEEIRTLAEARGLMERSIGALKEIEHSNATLRQYLSATEEAIETDPDDTAEVDERT